MRLLVRQFGREVGALESTPDRGVVFRYSEDYLKKQDARPLSLSLPLRAQAYSQAASMPFFAGLLPDGDLRRRIADYLHVSETSTLKLLDALGGECAGTVSIVRAGDDGEPVAVVDKGHDEYREISSEELASLVLEAARRPLLAPRGGARLSLAGAQDKLPLMYREGRWYLPLDDSPSSHILKPSSLAFADLVANEFFCMRLAQELGFEVPPVDLILVGRPALLVARFDREEGEDGRMVSIGSKSLRSVDRACGFLTSRRHTPVFSAA